ncbi:MAG: hypothetical protein R3B13_10740 [Polyangiaceae bacterium]
MRRVVLGLTLLASVVGVGSGCGSDDDGDGNGGSAGTGGRPEQTGAACDTPNDCYPDVADRTAIQGEVQCLDRVRDGYCTHQCTDDAECCAADGECKTGIKQVCSPFESTGLKMCFLSCESADRGGVDEQEYCQSKAGPEFICRSSGGGSQNRKVCVPGDCGVGASCANDSECTSGLTCVTGVGGGYCAKKGCATNADCGADALCVKASPESYCAKRCNGAGDCTFCRAQDVWASCSDTATFVEAGTTGSVCLPPAK